MSTMQLLITIGGVLHFGVLIASALVPRVLHWKSELLKLNDLSRQLVWTHGVFIVLVIVGFGLLSIVNAAALSDGTMLGRSLCAFIALFWLARLVIQLFVFDCRAYLRSAGLKTGYHGLTAVFTYFAAVYGAAALI